MAFPCSTAGFLQWQDWKFRLVAVRSQRRGVWPFCTSDYRIIKKKKNGGNGWAEVMGKSSQVRTQEYLILPLQHNTGVRQNLYVAVPSVRPLAYSFVALRSCLITVTVCAYRLLDLLCLLNFFLFWRQELLRRKRFLRRMHSRFAVWMVRQ